MSIRKQDQDPTVMHMPRHTSRGKGKRKIKPKTITPDTLSLKNPHCAVWLQCWSFGCCGGTSPMRSPYGSEQIFSSWHSYFPLPCSLQVFVLRLLQSITTDWYTLISKWFLFSQKKDKPLEKKAWVNQVYGRQKARRHLFFYSVEQFGTYIHQQNNMDT